MDETMTDVALEEPGVAPDTESTAAPGLTAPSERTGAAKASPGGRLIEAFVAVESFPIADVLCVKAREVSREDAFKPDQLAAIAGADLGLALVLIRRGGAPALAGGRPLTLEAAIRALGPAGVDAALDEVPTFDPLQAPSPADLAMQRGRAHALQVRNTAVEVALATGIADPGEVAIVALMHDLGRIVVSHLHPDYDPQIEFATVTPEDRIKRERSLFGIDHALVGGVLARRWDLPAFIAEPIERHHREGETGMAAVVALADQVAHYRAGDAVSLAWMSRLSKAVGLPDAEQRELMSGPALELAGTGNGAAPPCPLSARELDALARLSQGKVYKQIAEEMQLSVSTVRTHLHNVYGKLEVIDRAQAVLKARESGWL